MRKILTFGVIILAIVLASSFLDIASAQETAVPQSPDAVLLVEDFNFNGPLSSNGWFAHSGIGTNPPTTVPGLTYPSHPGSGIGNAALIGNAGGEDVNRPLSAEQTTSGSTVYFSFLVNVNEAAAAKTGDYFIHIGDRVAPDAFTLFAARVFVRVVDNNVNFGLSNTSTPTWGTTNFAKNTTYLVIVKYTIDITGNDPTQLWVIPSGVPATEAAAGAPEVVNTTTAGQDVIDALALRQGSNTNSAQTIVDGIRVGTAWADVTGGASAPAPAFRLFTSHLNGAKENPPVNTTGHGFGRVALNSAENQITVSVYYSRLSSGTTMGHIHGPAAAGANAGIIFDLMPPTGQTTGSVINRTFTVTPQQVADLRAGLWYFNIHTTNFPGGEIRGQILPPAAPSDFNGDSKTDYAVVRGGPGGASGTLAWWINHNGTNDIRVESFGFNSDYILPADFDGDGADDIAIWRSTGTAGFWVLRSSDFSVTFTAFGQEGDDPAVVADYTGDGVDDYAVYRPSPTSPGDLRGFWYLASSGIYNGQQVVVNWGLDTDLAIIGDYDGNGLADFTVVRPTGTGGNPPNVVYTLANMPNGSVGEVSIRQFGLSSDFFVPGDYDGDGITDLAISRAVGTSIRWIYRPSSGGNDVWTQWGRATTDFEAPGDYDGDGRTDIAVWRQSETPGSSTFIVMLSSGGVVYHPFGLAGDVLTFWEVK